VFDANGLTMRVNAALARLRAWRITETQGRTCGEVGLCGGGCPNCVVGIAARESRRINREIMTPDDRIFTVTTLPLSGGPASVVQFAKEVTEERRHAQARDRVEGTGECVDVEVREEQVRGEPSRFGAVAGVRDGPLVELGGCGVRGPTARRPVASLSAWTCPP